MSRWLLTLIGHHLIHSTSCDRLNEGEVAPPQHLFLQSGRLVIFLCWPGQHLEDGEHQRHEDLLQEGRHLPLPWQHRTQLVSQVGCSQGRAELCLSCSCLP